MHQRCTTSYLLVEAPPIYEMVYQLTFCWYGLRFSPVSAGQYPTRGLTSSIFHEYRTTYHGEANPDPVTLKGWGSKSSPPTSSNVRSITGAHGYAGTRHVPESDSRPPRRVAIRTGILSGKHSERSSPSIGRFGAMQTAGLGSNALLLTPLLVTVTF